MSAYELEFQFSILDTDDKTLFTLPHFAFIGRSNVGKSSLINMISTVKKTAKVSATPGKTRTLNFFLNPAQFYIVDMPGYGYAKVSKTTIEQWLSAIEKYFSKFEDRLHLFLLIDSRHPIMAADKDFIQWVAHFQFPKTILLTKIDKTTQKERNACIKSLKTFLSSIHADYPLLQTSAKTGNGKQDIIRIIHHESQK